jgi:hypothetical protein
MNLEPVVVVPAPEFESPPGLQEASARNSSSNVLDLVDPYEGDENATPQSIPLRRGARVQIDDHGALEPPDSEAVGDLQRMLYYLLAEDGDMRPFVAGQFCPATKEGIHTFLEQQKYAPPNDLLVDFRVWELLEQEVRGKARREEEKRQKRVEATRKAEFEREKRLKTQQPASEQSLTSLLSRTISDLGPAPHS